jgi:hypothetical protein
MNRQGKSSDKTSFSAAVRRDLQSAYQALVRTVNGRPWLVQGSVNIVAPKSPAASVTYTWTRKVRAKTVTVALSPEQAAAFRSAIEANRQIETSLAKLRELSHTALLAEVPGVTKRRLDGQKNAEAEKIPKGA